MVRLAAIQYRPPRADPDAARRELAALCTQAAEEGARLVVCPEMATCGYVWRSAKEICPHVEPMEGPTFAILSDVAKRSETWIVVGFPERLGSRLYNSALLIDTQGSLAACYRKNLLFELDHAWASPGEDRVFLDTGFGSLFPAICMDLNDWRMGVALRRLSPDIVAFCTNWVDKGSDVLSYWQAQLTGWQGWFVAANTWGEERGVRFCGQSRILGPGGREVAAAGHTGNAIIFADATNLDASGFPAGGKGSPDTERQQDA